MTSFLEDRSICAVSLSDYANIIGYDECAFWGVYYDGQIDYQCRMFWTEWQRMDVYRALLEAQELIENMVGFSLCPTWVVGDYNQVEQRYVDVQCYQNPVLTRWRHYITHGVRAEAVVSSGAAINYATEPATAGPLAATIGDVSEIKVYYPGTRREIQPIKKVYAGGLLTLYFPRCRLVANPNTIDTGIDYNVIGNFLTSVDIVRVYNDPSIAATLVADHLCGSGCSTQGCSEYTTTACILPIDHRLGIVKVSPATYSSGAWSMSSSGQGGYMTLRLNYLQGLSETSALLKSAIIRLAHARMATEPCGCNITQRLWERDRKAPEILSRERLNCPFGVSEGAWNAYKIAQGMKLPRLALW